MEADIFKNPEVERAVRRQRVKATVSSLFISLLSVVLVGILLMLFVIPGLDNTPPDIVSYQASSQVEDEVEVKTVTNTVKRKPASPSSSVAKVVVANTSSPTAIAVPELNTAVTSVDFGEVDDFGAGFGLSDPDSGEGGGVTFFGAKTSVQRVVFVIDYSKSMSNSNRVGIMKDELKKSLEGMTPGTQFQLILFAGPAWVAGGTVEDESSSDKAKKQNKVRSIDGKTYKWTKRKKTWIPGGRPEKVEWVTLPSALEQAEDGGSTEKIIAKYKGIVDDTPLVFGTAWEWPMEMALEMDPRPEVIYFMTDGVGGTDEIAEEIAKKARRKKIKINSFAMMEPKAHDAMAELARETGGEFVIVNQGGKHEKVNLE